MTPEPFAWIVFLQDWTGRGSDLPPRVVTKRFASKAEAEEHRARLRQRYPDRDTTLICLSPPPTRSPDYHRHRG